MPASLGLFRVLIIAPKYFGLISWPYWRGARKFLDVCSLRFNVIDRSFIRMFKMKVKIKIEILIPLILV